MERPKAPTVTGKLMYGEKRAKVESNRARKVAAAAGRSQSAAPRTARSA